MSYAIKFAGLTLDGIGDWNDSLVWRVKPETFPRRHGSIGPRLAFLDGRNITLSGEIFTANEAALKSYVSTLLVTLTDRGRDRLYKLDDNRYINAIATGCSHRFQAGSLPDRASQFSLQFYADDPFLYDGNTDSVLTSNVTTSPRVIAVTNNGGTKTPPLIEVKALGSDVTGVKISNSTIGLYVNYSGTITAGATLSIDCADFKAIVNGANALNLITGTIELTLEPGLNNIIYEGPTTGVDVNVVWLPRWL